ncbi:MAG: hypothetical protein NC111_00540 [Bacteroides sp.]|nr:hypothetical protein [Bacteroides sp.]MCM1414139.1 hypothetical protein [Bacteroides sp.]MCM1471005.1 hypothetical protein [Bacteroides sp.]
MSKIQFSSKSFNIGQLPLVKQLKDRMMHRVLKQKLPFDPDELMRPTTHLTQDEIAHKQSIENLEKARDKFHKLLFAENAWLLLDNAATILSDSKMAMAPVHIHNSVSYLGSYGFRDATLGVYLKWWLDFPETTRDTQGNLAFIISGLIGGSNYSKCVTPKGDIVDIAPKGPFKEIWQSFMTVNTGFAKAKKRSKVYSLEDVVIRLRGDNYRQRVEELRKECCHAFGVKDIIGD